MPRLLIRFLGTLLAHLLYDFHWQGAFITVLKRKSWFLLGVHSLTWALLLGAILLYTGGTSWWIVLFLAINHFCVDAWKTRYTTLPPLGLALWIAQGLHFITILVALEVVRYI